MNPEAATVLRCAGRVVARYTTRPESAADHSPGRSSTPSPPSPDSR